MFFHSFQYNFLYFSWFMSFFVCQCILSTKSIKFVVLYPSYFIISRIQLYFKRNSMHCKLDNDYQITVIVMKLSVRWIACYYIRKLCCIYFIFFPSLCVHNCYCCFFSVQLNWILYFIRLNLSQLLFLYLCAGKW